MAARCPDLPLLPGYSFNNNIGRTKFNMDPKFDFIGDVPALKEKVKPNMFGTLSDKYPSVFPRGEVTELPSWITFDKQILRFDAFFKSTLEEFRGSPEQVRPVKIYYFLEDGTIQVIEPRQVNSGLAQGTLITRHRIRFPAPMDDNFYDLIDLNIGREVEFYGRVFKITDCDRFTRTFLNRCGVPVPDPLETPPDPYFKQRRAEECKTKPTKKKNDDLKKFLENDRKVLRFYGYWDDQKTTYGYIHRLEILFYLADDTIEIREVMNEGCSKTTTFTFLHRAKLPKTCRGLPSPGADAKNIILNVLGSGLQGGRFLADPLSCGQEVVAFYREIDLFIGSIINCYGRKLVLTNCDPYTKEYYSSKYGLGNFEAMEMPGDKRDEEIKVTERELPPWNGYGTFEDSAQNCITVEPKAPHKDFSKFLTLDRIGLNSHTLRFGARMESRIPVNTTRRFIISYFLGDDSIAVYEYGGQNSGFASKMFFARNRINLPGQEYFTSKPPKYYKSHDMYIGATVIINSFRFVLYSADEYALRYMELHPHQYPKSNIKKIMEKIREKLRPTYKDFVAENMPKEDIIIPYDTLQRKLLDLLPNDFTEHEMITISRAFTPPQIQQEEKYTRDEIRAITLTELKRFLWDDLERLKEYFIMRDGKRVGVLSKENCYTILRACRLPLDKELLEKILKVIQRDNANNLYYQDIINFFDRSICNQAYVAPVNIKHELSCIDVPEYKINKYIDWCAFNQFLDLEDTFKQPQGKNTIDFLKKKQ